LPSGPVGETARRGSLGVAVQRRRVTPEGMMAHPKARAMRGRSAAPRVHLEAGVAAQPVDRDQDAALPPRLQLAPLLGAAIAPDGPPAGDQLPELLPGRAG